MGPFTDCLRQVYDRKKKKVRVYYQNGSLFFVRKCKMHITALLRRFSLTFLRDTRWLKKKYCNVKEQKYGIEMHLSAITCRFICSLPNQFAEVSHMSTTTTAYCTTVCYINVIRHKTNKEIIHIIHIILSSSAAKGKKEYKNCSRVSQIN